MNGANKWSRALVIVGLIAMLVGAIDPLEGSIVILAGAALVALGAVRGKSRHRRFLLWSFVLVAIGVGAMGRLSMLGGVGGATGRSFWWSLVVLPYPVGWIMGLVGTVRTLRESSKTGGPPKAR
jgi:hypothetical protein